MTVEKPKPKQLFRPITTGTNSTMNQSQFLAIICNSLKALGKSRVRGTIGFGFTSHWLKNWRESFQPITRSSNRNRVITFDTFDSHLKTALTEGVRDCTVTSSMDRRLSKGLLCLCPRSRFWLDTTRFVPYMGESTRRRNNNTTFT